MRKAAGGKNHLIDELTSAFVFHVAGKPGIDGHKAWLMQTSPRPGYEPPDKESKVLLGMQGKLWIDQASYQWIRVEAHVVKPVSLAGFLVGLQPGAEFALARGPIGGGIWLRTHFSMNAKIKVLSLIAHNEHRDETYYDYRKASRAANSGCPAGLSADTH